MAELVLIVANVLGMDEVRGVSNKGHIYQALRYVGSKRKAVTFDYDDLWQEYGASKESTYFYQLPLQPPRKDPSSLKKTKRRLYTKRYQWLDEIRSDVEANIQALMKRPLICSAIYSCRKPCQTLSLFCNAVGCDKVWILLT